VVAHIDGSVASRETDHEDCAERHDRGGALGPAAGAVQVGNGQVHEYWSLIGNEDELNDLFCMHGVGWAFYGGWKRHIYPSRLARE
jgi:hypothetical protein